MRKPKRLVVVRGFVQQPPFTASEYYNPTKDKPFELCISFNVNKVALKRPSLFRL